MAASIEIISEENINELAMHRPASVEATANLLF